MDTDRLDNLTSLPVFLPADDFNILPVNHVVLLRGVVGEGRFMEVGSGGFALSTGEVGSISFGDIVPVLSASLGALAFE